DASGVIVVRISIREDGVVDSATVTGRLELTPFAVCVERAVKSARFRRNQGGSLAYPFVLPATVRASDCGGLAPSKKVDAAALQGLTTPIGRCAGRGEAAVKISTRFSLDGKGVIRGAEAAPPHAGTRIGFCVERTLGCLIGSS